MSRGELRYTPSGHALILPGDEPDAVVDALLETAYAEEFCLSPSFDPPFLESLMAAGFLVMSLRLQESGGPGSAILLPKLHLERAVLDPGELRESRSVRRLLPRYELRSDVALETVIGRCAAVHGEDWLTEELRAAFRGMRAPGARMARQAAAAAPEAALAGTAAAAPAEASASPTGASARLLSFGLFRDGRLVAGEFGAVAGGVYTSYSGYRDENSAGTVQMVLTGRLLREAGFAFWDLGMPMEYKTALGARSLDRAAFVARFRSARCRTVQPLSSATIRS